jgi:hypothetical protein
MLAKLIEKHHPTIVPYGVHAEEGSLSSTCTADRAPQKQLILPTQRTTVDLTTTAIPVTKKVSFNLNLNQEHEIVKEEAVTWHSARDYKKFRRQRNKACDEARNVEDRSHFTPLSLGQVIAKVYMACGEATSDSKNVLSRSEQIHLRDCMSAKIVGVETCTVKAVCSNRSQRRKDLVEAIKAVQKDDDWDAEEIRVESETITLGARLFARELAHALAGNVKGLASKAASSR